MTRDQDPGLAADGQTDDSDALQRLIDSASGNVVALRGEAIRITRTVVVRLGESGRFSIRGDGVARILHDGAGPAIHVIGTHTRGSADPASIAEGVWERERMPMIADLEIVGLREESEGLRLEGTFQATIRNVLIRRCRRGVHLVNRNRNLLLADSHIYQGRKGGIGVHFDGVNLHQSNIVGCHISYQPHAGIKVERSEVRNLQITGCDIEYNHDPDAADSADVWIDAREGTIREGTITSCTIQAKESPGGSNVRIEGPDDPEASRGAGLWTIAGNVLQSQAVNLRLTSCRGVTATGNSFASGFERSLVIDRCRIISVGASTFDYNPDYTGARFDGITVRESRGVNLHGLVLEKTRGGDERGGGAIDVQGCSEVTLSACQVLDPESRGIAIAGSRNVVVQGCTVADRRAAGERTLHEAVRVSSSEAVSVAGNLIVHGRAGGLTMDPACGLADGNLTLP